MACLRWLSEQGYLPAKGRLLDIGESCLLGANPEDIHFIHQRHGGRLAPDKLAELAEVFARRSRIIGNPLVPTLFLSEMIELTDVEYIAFDVVRARKAELFDLNKHSLAPARRNGFDLVINFGTTEHLVHQFNALKVIHEATRPGGYIFHQVPSTGYINHGYFAYNPLLFRELAEANGYETAAMWYWGQAGSGTVVVNPAALPGDHELRPAAYHADGSWDVAVPNSVLNVLFRKVHDAPFRVGLEVATAAAILNVPDSYTSTYIERVANQTDKNLYSDIHGPQPSTSPLWRRIARRVKRLPGIRRLAG
jgi:hypothetical protein